MSPFANSSKEVIKGFLKPPQDILFDRRMDGIEVRIRLFLKDQQSGLIFVDRVMPSRSQAFLRSARALFQRCLQVSSVKAN